MSFGKPFRLEDLSPKQRAEVEAALRRPGFEYKGREYRGVPAGPLPEPVHETVTIRQKTKKMPKTEADFWEFLRRIVPPGARIYHQALTLLIANGLRYTPDFLVVSASGSARVAYEVKGPYAYAGALEKLKVAANEHPWLTFTLATRDGPAWKLRAVLPLETAGALSTSDPYRQDPTPPS